MHTVRGINQGWNQGVQDQVYVECESGDRRPDCVQVLVDAKKQLQSDAVCGRVAVLDELGCTG
jgi:hypothetical protein